MDKAKILIVDDLVENLYSLEQIIEKEDREIFSASSGNEALKLARKHEFALVITDVQMPEMNGFEFIEVFRSKKNTQNVPVIFATAINKEKKYVIKGYSEGAVDYLYKPLDPDIVSAKVDIFVTLYNQKRALELQYQELDTLNKLKNKFLGIAAHDIRNPLAIIEFYSKSLLKELGPTLDDPSRIQELENIFVSTKFAQNLVNDFLDISKMESGNIELEEEMIDVNYFLESNIQFNQIFANKKNINLVGEINLKDIRTAFDKNKMNQVLNNLITNAIKFSHEGTSIHLKAQQKGNQLLLSVQDEGQGIPKNEITHLFDPFAKTSVKSTAGEKSTGLGLMIVKKIVDAHKGEITVTSKVGIGSCFNIELPIKVIDVIEASPNQAKGHETNIGDEKLNIVVVDDDVLMRTLSEVVFNKIGGNITMLEDGEALLDQVDVINPDLVFTDINMPGINGYDMVKQIRNKGIDIPIFGLTGLINDEVQKLSKKSGMDGVYEKPPVENMLKHLVSLVHERNA
ncbi:response regulator [Flagellimonas sp. CMM7]|uniref:hybrid sensor histidine kinase/response regulator n=1 Tax=Flagellimonas sp. CMM7 TaxID=2654676 RepID=UPI0013D79F28|nr:response regulator [Flagellimonas sp. CMM7]UII79323.1 response regulator [Flagellimonas sp. CMM7]